LVSDRRPRPEVAETVVQLLRRAGLRVVPPTGWESYDALVLASALVGAELVTSAHPPGWLQLRLRRFIRPKPALLLAAIISVAALTDARLAIVLAAAAVANLALGWWRTGPGVNRVLTSRGTTT